MTVDEYVELELHAYTIGCIDSYCDEFDAPEGINQAHMTLIVNYVVDLLDGALGGLDRFERSECYIAADHAIHELKCNSSCEAIGRPF